MKKFFFCLIGFTLHTILLFAQSSTNWVFDDSTLPEVYILIEQDSLDLILDSENEKSNYEYPATFIFKKDTEIDTVFNIGFRLRGNTSRSSQKKSFKVSFNTFEKGREYKGLDKMNLNGEHNDPTIMRAKLSWEIFEAMDIPAPRANHVKLFINDEYFGLYLNVEHIDNEFVKDRFGSDTGNLYKSLYPADLSYISENADDYKWTPDWADRRVYDLKTNTEEDDYSDLASLISFLENSTGQEFETQIEDYINLDGVLRWMAVDILTGNWDNYWYNQNNYYLYFNPVDERFEFIPYDYDNTFGIDWLGQDWGTRDINNWGPGGTNRPLTNRILEIDEFRNRLNFYVNKIIEDVFNEETLFPEIDRLKALTEDAAEEDIYRTLDWDFGISDYHISFTSAVTTIYDHVKYGLKPYITTRVNSALEQVELNNITPIIKKVKTNFSFIDGDETLTIKATVLDDDEVTIVTAQVTTDQTIAVVLLDDGVGRDKEAKDGIFTGTFNALEYEGEISFYITATDPSDQTERFPKNPSLTLTEQLGKSDSPLLINELMASNSSTITDEGGAFADWLEIYNPSDDVISLSGFYLSDNLTIKNKWAFPDTVIQPKSFMLVWVDDDEKEGPLHASFNLSKEGEDIGLFEQLGETYLTVDAFAFPELGTDVSFGRSDGGSENLGIFSTPTPGSANGIINPTETEKELPQDVQLFQNYPNPFNPETTISFQLNEPSNIRLEVFTIEGRLVQTLVNSRYLSGIHSIRFDASGLSSGMYFYRLETKNQSLTKRLVLIK